MDQTQQDDTAEAASLQITDLVVVANLIQTVAQRGAVLTTV